MRTAAWTIGRRAHGGRPPLAERPEAEGDDEGEERRAGEQEAGEEQGLQGMVEEQGQDHAEGQQCSPRAGPSSCEAHRGGDREDEGQRPTELDAEAAKHQERDGGGALAAPRLAP